jgi:ABC-type transport system involved in multi-copper enzyme maturation permease subunit
MRNILTIAHLTLHEAMRRRILLAAAIGGGAFLVLFGVGLAFMLREINSRGGMQVVERAVVLNLLTLAGLYATNFLMVMTAVLLPVDTLSGEISSGVIQTVAAKPIRRADIVLGKWLGHAVVLAVYFVVLAGGVLAIARLVGNFTPPRIEQGLPLILLEGLVLLSLSIAGGTRLSTVTNGILAFGLYGLAFIGNWVEQIGTLTHNDAARYVGTVASLIMPSEALWQRAAWHMQPSITQQLGGTPLSPLSVPSPAMVWWAAGYAVVAVGLGVWGLKKRAL